MNWLRDTLKKNRAFVLALLLVETFYFVDAQQFVYAHEIREQEREVHLRHLSALLDVPVEKLRGEPRSLFEPLGELAGDVSSSVGVALDDLISTLRRQTRRATSGVSRLASRLDEVLAAAPVASAEPVAYLGSPQAAEEPEISKLRPAPRAAAAVAQDAPRERTGRTSRPELKPLPLRRVERKARTEKAVGPARSAASSAVAPSLVRQVIPKENVAPEIAALAESLGDSPAEIFGFVHDEIDFDPKWGAQKSPLGTLQERQGTSWDQAWLLQQLLTAAGVDARLVWGEVEIPAEMLQNITGVEDPWRAGDLLTTAGTPIVLLVEGSQVRTARMSHVWVKAHLDYFPDRGATPGPGDTWIRMDPSLKRFAIAGDLRLDEAVPYDLGEYLQSGTELSPRQFYEEALDAYVADNHPEISSLEELKRTKSVVQEGFPFVPGTLRGKILSLAGESVEVPESFQQRLKLEVREAGGPVLASYSTPWPAVHGKRLELVWPGATSADQATLDLYGGVFSTPPFEVDLKPSIRVEGVEVAAGGSIGSAEDVVVQATLTTPQGLATVVPFEMWAGEHAVLSLDFGRTPQETVDRYTQELAAATEASEQAAWSLALAGALYQRRLGADLDHLAELRWQRVLNLGTAVLAVQRGAVSVSPGGTPLTFSKGPTALDLGSMPLGLFPAEGAAVPPVSTMELLGSQSSYLEGEALSQVFAGDHVTGVTFLTRAVRDGQTLTRVDAANLDKALGAVELSHEAEATVRAAVEEGWIAWIPESHLLVDTFEATGYVLEDPATGAAGYFVTYERLVQGLDANIVFHSPQDLDVVTAPIDVVATIESEALESWTLNYQMAGEGPAVTLATGEGSVTNGTLAEFDPTLLLNGLYDIVLTGRDIAGQSVAEKISVAVEGNMKIGNFSLSFVDLSIPVSGLAINVVRTYDSRDNRKRDFGIGWDLDIRQGSYRNNRSPGDGWRFHPALLPCQVIQETKTHLTMIRLSDREIYRFKLKLSAGAPVLGGCFASAGFEYVEGSFPDAKLEIVGNAQVFYENGSERVIDPESFEVFEPRHVRLTTRDLRSFDLDLALGVTKVVEGNGNSLEISPQGIFHSSGKSIAFQRDEGGRILTIEDPEGGQLIYEYDNAGDLSSFTDQEGNVDRFSYDELHLMTELENPRGNAARNEYDDDGRLIRTIDPLGNSIELTHEIGARRELVRDRRGFVRIYEYDQRGNVVKETDASGKTTLRTYDGKDNLLSETDPLGNTTSYTYDEKVNLIAVVDPLGQARQWTYNSFGTPLKVTDPNGNETSFTYDEFGNRTRVVDPLGNVLTRVYDANGNLTSVTDPEGNTTTQQYNVFGDVVSKTDPLGNTTAYEYDLNGNQVTETKVRSTGQGDESVVRRLQYDRLGRLTSITDAEGAVITNSYDGMDNTPAVTNALGQTTEFEYDAVDRLTLIRDPDGLSMQQLFNAEGKVIRQVGRDGKVTEIGYSPNNDLVAVTSPGGLSSRNILDDLGRVVGTVDALGETSTFELDANGRLIRAVHSPGRETVYSRDANGNVLSMTGRPGGQSTSIEYDALNRIVGVTASDGSRVQMTYSSTGLVTSQTDPLGRTNHFAYDPLGRLTAVTDALGNITSYVYDELGSVSLRTDASGRSTRIEYDKSGRVTKQILVDGKFETMEYDEGGNLTAHTDFMDRRETFRYGPYGPVLERTSENDGPVLYSYTPSGRRASVVDHRGTTSYVYDEPGRLSELVHPDGRRLSYGYDGAGRLIRMTVHIDQQLLETSYAYDTSGRLVTIIDPVGGEYSYSYSVAGNLEMLSYPNGVVTTYAHDTLNRLAGLESRTQEGEVIQSYAYNVDTGGRRTLITEQSGRTREFGYDDLDRLTSESVRQSGDLIYQSVFSYDPVGNRLNLSLTDASGVSATSYEYDSRDRLLSAGETTHTWNASGNLTSRTDAEGGVIAYAWDDHGRLRSVTMPDGVVVSHDYDADGRRVRTEVTDTDGSKEVKNFLVDSSSLAPRVVAETDSTGGFVSLYVYGLGIGPVAAIRPDGDRYFHVDGLGSTRILTDEGGLITDTYSYTAFGELEEHVGGDSNRHLFAGATFDARTGLYDLYSRWMDPRTGRFLSMDPIQGRSSEPRTQHAYLYSAADPVNNLDPDGKFYLSLSVIFGLIQKPLEQGATLKVRQNHFPLFIRVRPIIGSGANWPASYALQRIDRAAAVLGRAAGVIPVYSGNAPEYSNLFPVEPTQGEADKLMEEYSLREYRGDGKSIPILYINQFRYERHVQGFAISPELVPGTKARGVTLPRLFSFLRGLFVSDGSLDPNWSPAIETCKLAAAHELGHALGVPHSSTSGLLMSDGNCSQTGMTPAEISTVRSVAWTLR